LPTKLSQPTYNDLVFINCPFDDAYNPLLRAAVYTVYFCGFYPISAMDEDNAMDNRIDKLYRMIAKCKFGIHDISRTELDPDNSLPRFNMPFELGVFYGARAYGQKQQKDKNAIIFEKKKYLYQKYLSDINGIDTKAHNNDPFAIIRHVRNWLRLASRRTSIPGAQAIINRYNDFLAQLPAAASAAGFSTVDDIPFNDYCQIVEEAIRAVLPK
jgi:hypothetical protein